MTDKVQKIREDVERLCNAGLHNSTISKKNVLNTILAVVNDFKEEPVSKELEEACEKFRWNIEESCYQNDNGTYTYSSDNIEEAFKAGAKWQEAKDQEIIETAIHHAYHNGKLEMKEQIMKEAVDATLLNGNLIKQKHTIHPLHVGDKVKVIVIKED